MLQEIDAKLEEIVELLKGRGRRRAALIRLLAPIPPRLAETRR
jgi:hypothetical protein